jgi:hypothetical protein
MAGPLSLNGDAVARIASNVALRRAGVDVVGVTVSGGSDYVEVLVRVSARGSAPSLHTMGLFRDRNEAELTRNLVEGLERMDRRPQPFA